MTTNLDSTPGAERGRARGRPSARHQVAVAIEDRTRPPSEAARRRPPAGLRTTPADDQADRLRVRVRARVSSSGAGVAGGPRLVSAAATACAPQAARGRRRRRQRQPRDAADDERRRWRARGTGCLCPGGVSAAKRSLTCTGARSRSSVDVRGQRRHARLRSPPLLACEPPGDDAHDGGNGDERRS